MSLSGDYDTYVEAVVNASVFTQLFNVTDAHSMSVPFFIDEQNLPIGVDFSARFGNEATLFRIVAQLEKERPWFDKLPNFS